MDHLPVACWLRAAIRRCEWEVLHGTVSGSGGRLGSYPCVSRAGAKRSGDLSAATARWLGPIGHTESSGPTQRASVPVGYGGLETDAWRREAKLTGGFEGQSDIGRKVGEARMHLECDACEMEQRDTGGVMTRQEAALSTEDAMWGVRAQRRVLATKRRSRTRRWRAVTRTSFVRSFLRLTASGWSSGRMSSWGGVGGCSCCWGGDGEWGEGVDWSAEGRKEERVENMVDVLE
ncbi:hypothetical protein B0H21DRAFT_90785 [Amylocystis lapponica]|nr:hypothetical protein B0H21DRAFT_90785 [Amylocystis lapponica]